MTPIEAIAGALAFWEQQASDRLDEVAAAEQRLAEAIDKVHYWRRINERLGVNNVLTNG